VDLTESGEPDYDAIRQASADEKVTGVMIQRSRGYGERKALTVEEIGEICKAVRRVNAKAHIMVDNCYGEFTDVIEPTHVGADIVAGSLIKNPGGGIAPTGGYVAGTKELVDRAAMRLTTPGIGGECGSTLGNNRLLFQGLFMAPHIVAQALKTAVVCASMMEQLGLESSPAVNEKRSDIIQMIKLGDPEKMKRFCLGIQAGAHVDSYVTPEPWPMPGYDCPVIMAAGAFVQGSSIEISADGPMREPYIVYMQGGLTYESGKLGIMMAVSAMLEAEGA
jgi:cystathionine beta-lyase family protein involved in aluminum resistance